MMVLRGVRALNSSTTYGVDQSASNNYGLGSSFASTAKLKNNQAASAAKPSLMWLVVFIFILAVL